MQPTNFMNYFEENIYQLLAHRAGSFKFAFEFLSNLNRPVCIVETGCVRTNGSFAGDGQSTILFDKFAQFNPGSIVHSVDINPTNTDLCKSLVTENVKVHTSDSVSFLKNQCASLIAPFHSIDLLYLDSYDLDLNNPHDSALHHIKELLAASKLVNSNTLILIDDSPSTGNLYTENGKVHLLSKSIGGKGKYIVNYMNDIGKTPVYESYQVAYLGL